MSEIASRHIMSKEKVTQLFNIQVKKEFDNLIDLAFEKFGHV